MLEQLINRRKTLGVKQSVKAIRNNRAAQVYIGHDADPALTEPVKILCREKALSPCEEYSMKELGAAGGIAVGAAVIAVLKD